jgi:hypothetical protein
MARRLLPSVCEVVQRKMMQSSDLDDLARVTGAAHFA